MAGEKREPGPEIAPEPFECPDQRSFGRLRSEGRPTVPTRLGEERTYNPFMRVTSPALVDFVKRQRPEIDGADPVQVLGAVRALKDVF